MRSFQPIVSHVIVAGGFDGNSRLRSVERYDLDLDQWSFVANLTTSRAGCGGAVV